MGGSAVKEFTTHYGDPAESKFLHTFQTLPLCLPESVAPKPVLRRFYAPDGYQDDPEGGCDYVALVQDVCGYDLGPFVHRVEQVITFMLRRVIEEITECTC